MFEYRIVETGINHAQVDTNKFYLFLIAKPDDTYETSYATKWHTGINNYLVDYDYDTDSATIVNSIVTNYVNYVHVTAEKIWQDENNLYGIRPTQITFRLTRSIGGEPDTEFKWDQIAN